MVGREVSRLHRCPPASHFPRLLLPDPRRWGNHGFGVMPDPGEPAGAGTVTEPIEPMTGGI
jgi:hypothetical protein